MNLVALLLALPSLGAGVFALWWVNRRLPKGRNGVGVSLAATLVIPPLAIAAWFITLSHVTTATYVCLECGRTESQERFLFVPLACEVVADGEDYVQRFSKPVDHPHRWHLDGCIRSAARSVSCTEQSIGGWFRVLPQLKDRAAADQLYREACELPEDRRLSLMQEVSQFVWIRSVTDGDLEPAFARWNSQRRSR